VNAILNSESISPSQARATVHAFSSKRDSPASSYGYYESQIVENVALAGHKVELIDGVREFTDWDALGAQIKAFLQADL